MGNIRDGVTNEALKEEFSRCNVYARKECNDCFARLYCSGGCSANAYHYGGSLSKTYDIGCQLHRKRIECAIMIKVAEAFGNETLDSGGPFAGIIASVDVA